MITIVIPRLERLGGVDRSQGDRGLHPVVEQYERDDEHEQRPVVRHLRNVERVRLNPNRV